MAALDFGMALARGMLPTSEKAQKDLANLAGGRNIFKSEDWWNKAVDKQISEGFRESETGKEYMTKSGQYVLGERKVSRGRGVGYGGIGGGPITSYKAPTDAVITGYTRGGGNIFYNYSPPSPIYQTREVDVYGDFSKRKDFTARELSKIESSARRGAEEAKRETAASKAGRKRLARGTGGLVGKAVGPDTTGLPSLGSGGLGVTASLLGTETKL